MKKELICINCPMSCHLQVELNDKNEVVDVQGNTCPRGDIYARKELTKPERMITSTVRIVGGVHPLLPVITETTVDKDKIFDVMKAIQNVKVESPIAYHQVIIENVCDTGVNVIASRSMDCYEQ